MKRVIAFIMLKVGEILAVWLLAVQVPVCLGAGVSYVLNIEYMGGFMYWLIGLLSILILIVIVLLFTTLFIYSSDTDDGKGWIISWIMSNWKEAGQIK